MRSTRLLLRSPRLLQALVLALVMPLAARSLHADAPTARNPLLALLPAEAGEVTFIDAEELRRSPHYGELKSLLLPPSFHQFERYLGWVGIDLDRNVHRLLLSFTMRHNAPDEIVGLAEGDFDPGQAQRFFEQQQLPLADYGGYVVFPFGSGTSRDELVFVFLDGTTAAFGPRAAVEKLVDIRGNRRPGLERNETMLRLIKEVNGRSHIWMVMDREFTRRGLGMLLPTSQTMPDFRRAADRIDASTLQLEVGRNLDSFFVARCRTSVDSYFFSAALQVALWAQRLKYADTKPELATVMENTEVNATGTRLEVMTHVEEATLAKVLRERLAEASR